LANELVRDFDGPTGTRMYLKMDIKKAFETVNREFVYFIIHSMGLSYKWIN